MMVDGEPRPALPYGGCGGQRIVKIQGHRIHAHAAFPPVQVAGSVST